MKRPIYLDIYERIAADIMSGVIAPGAKLPSKRQLESMLGVSRTTVEAAYAALISEGYVFTKQNSGHYACPIDRLPAPAPAPAIPIEEPEEKKPAVSLLTGETDVTLFPFPTWAKIAKEQVYSDPRFLKSGNGAGDIELRRELCSFLREIRGVNCVPSQIVIGAGIDYILRILLQILPRTSAFALEDPGYTTVLSTVTASGRKTFHIPVDKDGMCVSVLSGTPAEIAYVTPSHQFPMGVTMPVARRTELLRWAGADERRYIIEDDYDSEFRYSSKPIPAMQGMDGISKVIYIGTFSRSLAPSIRIAFAVLPPRLSEIYRASFKGIPSTVSRFDQQTLCAFMSRGLYARHLRRAVGVYRQKQALFRSLLSEIPGVTLSGAQAGLHFLVTAPEKSEKELVAAAAGEDVAIRGLSEYRRENPVPERTLVLGFGGVDTKTIPAVCERLKRVLL